jgi:hypothetical protein
MRHETFFNSSTTTKGITMIKPTIGRVVLFFAQPGQAEPYPALITYVHSDSLINVGGFNHNGEPIRGTSVELVQDGDERPSGMRAEWMPYQKGQAAKTEALEKQVAGA